MIVKPKVRGFICTTAHPAGCAENVRQQIDYVQAQAAQKNLAKPPKRVLVLGCSTGYGLASRIVSSFAFGAQTIGVMFEKDPTDKKTASAGFYNNQAFERAAAEAGLTATTFNMDAFSHEAKQEVIAAIKAQCGQVDLVVYSLASPKRKDPDTGEVYSSVLKPVGEAVTRKTYNTDSKQVHEVTLEPASDEEIAATVKVMGGEDWELWLAALAEADVLAPGVQTLAYTYIGKEITWPIYGKASIGKAKEDLDRAAKALCQKLEPVQGQARIAVLKALVTQASSAIPVMPLYISLLYRVMKDQGTHEGCIEQIWRLLGQELYAGQAPTLDDQGRVRVDLWELDDRVQAEVERLWHQVNSDNVSELADVAGYQDEFFRLFGFGFDAVDYDAEVDPLG